MNKMQITLWASIALAAPLGSEAWASRIPSDTPNIVSPTYCTIGSPCAASNLGALTGDTDSTLVDNIYIYDEGIVSLNGPLPVGADLSNPSTLGTSFLAPGLIQSGTYVEAYCAGSVEGDASFGCSPNEEVEILFATGNTLFGVGITDDGPAGAAMLGKISVTFDYGATGPFPADTMNMPSQMLPSGAYIGYNIGGQKLWTLAPPDPGATDQYNGTFDASIPGTPFGTPEPDAWLLMLLGFGLVGVSLRFRATDPVEAI